MTVSLFILLTDCFTISPTTTYKSIVLYECDVNLSRWQWLLLPDRLLGHVHLVDRA
jgi:hypothetical protein